MHFYSDVNTTVGWDSQVFLVEVFRVTWVLSHPRCLLLWHHINWLIHLMTSFFLVALRPEAGSWPPLTGLHNHTPHTVGPLWGVINPSQRPLPDSTQHSQETDTHAPGGIRTNNPSKRAAADPHRRRRGHWDRPNYDLKRWSLKFI